MTANERRDTGIAAAINHAEAERPGWSELAYGWLIHYVTYVNQGLFMCEQVRKYAESRGLESPPSKRAWGSLMQRAQREKLIRFYGYERTTNPNAHRTPAAIWVKG